MKIAIWTDMYLEVAGGIPSVVRAQKDFLEKHGHEVVVFCPGWTTQEKHVEIVPTWKWLKPNGAPLAKSVKKIMAWAEQKYPRFAEFDIVHVHYELACSIAGAKMAKKYGIPLVQTMHGREDVAMKINVPTGINRLVALVCNVLHARVIPHRRKVKKNDRLAPDLMRQRMWEIMVNQANFADVVLTPSVHFAEKLKTMGVEKEIIATPGGVDTQIVKKDFTQRDWDGVRPLEVIWHSRVSKEKRILVFLETMEKIDFPVNLKVFGVGNQLGAAKRFVRRKKMTQRVQFFGQVAKEKIIEEMQKSDLCVSASYDFDTQGMTLVEAEATGLPVLFCDKDMGEVVPKGGGIMTEGIEAEDSAQALEDLQKQPEKIKVMSQVMLKARDAVDIERRMQKITEIYENLIEKRGSGSLK